MAAEGSIGAQRFEEPRDTRTGPGSPGQGPATPMDGSPAQATKRGIYLDVITMPDGQQLKVLAVNTEALRRLIGSPMQEDGGVTSSPAPSLGRRIFRAIRHGVSAQGDKWPIAEQGRARARYAGSVLVNYAESAWRHVNRYQLRARGNLAIAMARCEYERREVRPVRETKTRFERSPKEVLARDIVESSDRLISDKRDYFAARARQAKLVLDAMDTLYTTGALRPKYLRELAHMHQLLPEQGRAEQAGDLIDQYLLGHRINPDRIPRSAKQRLLRTARRHLRKHQAAQAETEQLRAA